MNLPANLPKNSFSSRTPTGSMSVFDMETPKTGWIHSEVETGLTYFNIFSHCNSPTWEVAVEAAKWHQLPLQKRSAIFHNLPKRICLSAVCQLDFVGIQLPPMSLEPVGKVLGRSFCCSKTGKRWSFENKNEW